MIVSDVSIAVSVETAKDVISLVMFSVDTVLDGGQAGTFASSPVAVMPEKLCDARTESYICRLFAGARSVTSAWNSFPKLIADVAAIKLIDTGAIVRGAVKTLSVSLDDTLRIEMRDKSGHSIFSAIER